MAKKEVNTDLWVYELLKEAGIRENLMLKGVILKKLTKL